MFFIRLFKHFFFFWRKKRNAKLILIIINKNKNNDDDDCVIGKVVVVVVVANTKEQKKRKFDNNCIGPINWFRNGNQKKKTNWIHRTHTHTHRTIHFYLWIGDWKKRLIIINSNWNKNRNGMEKKKCNQSKFMKWKKKKNVWSQEKKDKDFFSLSLS